jgi:hypothetical protein
MSFYSLAKESGLLPSPSTIIGMSEDVTNEDLASRVVNLSDEAVLVATDIENRVLAHLIGGPKGGLKVGEHRPISFFRYAEPMIQTTLRFWMY